MPYGVYGSPAPYEEAANQGRARMSTLQRIAMALAGAGQGIQSLRPGVGPLGSALTGFSRGFILSNASKRAAEDYAMKQQEAEAEREFRKLRTLDIESQIEARAKEKPEAIDTKQRDYQTLIGQGLSPTDARQIVWGATLSEQAKQKADLKLSEEDVPAMSDEALNIAADMYVNSGLLPGLGMGQKAGQARMKILERAAARHPGANVASNKAGLSAGTRSLSTLQNIFNSASAWEETASRNADVMLEALKDLPDTGTRFGNKIARYLASQTGDPRVAKFNAARETIKVEYARLLSSPGVGNAVLSDQARRELEGIISGDYTKAQMRSALQVLKRDAKNRRTAYKAQIESIKAGIGSTTGGGAAGAGDMEWIMDANGNLVPVGQ